MLLKISTGYVCKIQESLPIHLFHNTARELDSGMYIVQRGSAETGCSDKVFY